MIATGLGAPLLNATGNGSTGEFQLNGSRILIGPDNNPDRGPWNPIWTALAGSYGLYADEEFAIGNNSVALYDNSGGGKVTLTRVSNVPGVPNTTGYCLKLSYLGGGTPDSNPTPGYGGFFQSIIPNLNRTYVQRFIAKLPVGYNLVLAENAQGTNNTSYWLTPTVGTGKWEQYIRVSHAGNSLLVNGIASIPNGGTGYVVGNVLTVVGGTLAPGGSAAQVTVTSVSAGVITGLSVTTPGSYIAPPPAPATFSGGSGSGANVYLTYNLGTGGHVYVSGAGPNAAFDWYVASCNVFEVNSAGKGAVPLGGIIPFLKSITGSPGVPPDYVECNGGTYLPPNSTYPFWNGGTGITLPDLNGAGGSGNQRFLRGAATSGGTGGSDSHSHSIPTSGSISLSTGSTSVTTVPAATNSTTILPPYYQVVYIMRVR